MRPGSPAVADSPLRPWIPPGTWAVADSSGRRTNMVVPIQPRTGGRWAEPDLRWSLNTIVSLLRNTVL
eukprot:8324065-Lingulodinium_polyedra.AAC.1